MLTHLFCGSPVRADMLPSHISHSPQSSLVAQQGVERHFPSQQYISKGSHKDTQPAAVEPSSAEHAWHSGQSNTVSQQETPKTHSTPQQT